MNRRAALALEILICAAVYFAVARIGLEMAFSAEQVSVVWPATGLAIALLFLRGRHLWMAIALGAVAANLTSGASPLAAIGIATGNTLEAVVGVTLLRSVNFEPALKRVRDVGALLLLIFTLSPLISATLGVMSLCATGMEPWTRFWNLWGFWWIGDAIGGVIVAPLIFTWVDQSRRGWQLQRLAESSTLAIGLLLLSLTVFVEPGSGEVLPVHYLIFPAVIWASLRLGQHATSILVFGGTAVTTLATLAGRGPFVEQTVNASLLDVVLFMGVVAITGLFLGAAMSERNRAERMRGADYAQLRISEERLAIALAAGRMGAWEWNIRTGSVEWSRTIEALHGLEPGTFRGTFEAFREVIHPEDLEYVLEAIRHAVASSSKFEIEFRVVWPNGTVRWIETSAQVVEADGRADRMVGISRDATEHRSINEALTRQAAQLAEADRRKDEFLAVLGHELRNPLAPLQNSVELLKHRATDPAVIAQARAIMERQLRHLVRLVDDLLDVARIRSGKIVLNRQRIDLNAAVNSAIELSRPGIEARRHQLTVSLPDDPLWVEADSTRLPQLLANLLNNAAKYTPEAGRIALIARREGAHVVVRVSDTGIGMSSQDLSGVFELFAQAGVADHAVQGGLGVGLSLAKSLAELHDGSLTAHSEGRGRGSEFVLKLPGARADVASLSSLESTANMPRPALSLRVLVVDDNVDAAESLRMLLKESGHRVRTAHSGVQALQVAKNFLPDVMILDLGMPEMDGYAVARAIHNDATLASTRLIALSGYGQLDDRRRTTEAGFEAHLVKPAEPDSILTAVLSGASVGSSEVSAELRASPDSSVQ